MRGRERGTEGVQGTSTDVHPVARWRPVRRPGTGGAPPIVRLAALLAVLALVAPIIPGCGGGKVGYAPLRPSDSTAAAESGTAPPWSRQPHSWGKLDEIERWLSSRAGANASAFWVIEARLQLAEGRLAFAGQEREGSTDPATLAFRRAAAREDFDAVLALSGEASRSQLSRARAGSMRLAKLEVTAPSSATPSAASAQVPIDGLVRRDRWGARAADPRNMARSTGRWRWITVHHSVFSSTSDDLASSLETVRRIQREHQSGQGYADIGYHYLIDRAGRVIEGRSLRWRGAHAGGSNNVGNVGICLLGNFEEEHPSAAAMRSLERLIVELQSELSIPRRNVRPHRHWKETECPGRNLMPWFARF